jgi:SAM-dependent methyltransferase
VRFDSPTTARTYSDRVADGSWSDWAGSTLAPAGRDVVDIGCGGGIYSRAFAALGARSVRGIDASSQYVEEASANAPLPDGLHFSVGAADATGLPAQSADIVFERALIHHLSDAQRIANAREARRVLKAGGLLAVQDRTLEDVRSSHPDHWIRSTLFDAFPRLLDFERGRRPSRAGYSATLARCGFATIDTLRYDEVRRSYADFAELEAAILARKGKSILYQLTDAELRRYCERLRAKASTHPLIERDPWTVWLATR